MNELTESLLKSHPAKLLIAVYAADEQFRGAYLESHVVDKEGKVMEGKPLRLETISGLVDVFFDERLNNVNVGGLIPPNMLHFQRMPGGKYTMVWHRPAEIRQIYFSERLHLPSGNAWVPSLVYWTNGKSLQVFALASDDRPTENTGLLMAPFHNVNNKGDVCLGTATVKKPANKTYNNLCQYWEDMFWLSEFSEMAAAYTPTKTNLNLLWKRLVKNKKLTWSDLNEMKELKGMTVKKLL